MNRCQRGSSRCCHDARWNWDQENKGPPSADKTLLEQYRQMLFLLREYRAPFVVPEKV